MIRLKGVDILLTYACTGRCAHCCYRAGPDRSETMSVAEVEGYLGELAGQPVQHILLFGGEPFLVPDLLRASVARAARLARVLVFTNGYWATDAEVARQRLAELQAVGLDHVLFSVDAFHQAHVPLERIATGIQAARELGYHAIEVDNRYLGEPGADHLFNRRTQELMARLARLCDLSGVTVYQGPLRMVGRAADQLSPFVARAPSPQPSPFQGEGAFSPPSQGGVGGGSALARSGTSPSPRPSPSQGEGGRCPLPDYLGGDLRAPTGVEIHPGGWVNLCAGLALGNARERPLQEILEDYDPGTHPIIRVLAQEGPQGLWRLARRAGYALPGGYVDGCHLCYQARSLLRDHYPDHLAPGCAYVEEVPRAVLQLQQGIIYGPVRSRRLGNSLGINLLPTDRKVCSFDCAYCHYGRTEVKMLFPAEEGFPGVGQVVKMVEEALRTRRDFDFLTFSGNGEPTLYPQFPAVVAAIRRLRDELRPEVKLAILSNSTTVHLPHIREALAFFDVPIMKLDAGDPRTLAAINRPVRDVKVEHIVEGLKAVPRLVVQSVLIDGEVSNVRGEPFEAWLAALGEIRPAGVQIYSTDRPVPDAGVERVPSATLQHIAGEIKRRTGLQVQAYWAR